MTRPPLARAADSALVVVDIQERLAAAMPEAARAAVIRNTRLLLEAAGRLGIPVALTEQYPRGLGPTAGDVLAALPEGTRRAEKTCFSCAGAVDPGARAQVVLAGMEAHVCVLQSALEWRAAGREVFVVEDACCSRNAANHANAMRRLGLAGVVVANTESVLFEWLRDARHEQFKAISGLLK